MKATTNLKSDVQAVDLRHSPRYPRLKTGTEFRSYFKHPRQHRGNGHLPLITNSKISVKEKKTEDRVKAAQTVFDVIKTSTEEKKGSKYSQLGLKRIKKN